MQSYLIVYSDPEFAKKKIGELSQTFHASAVNTITVVPDPSVKIEQIRELIKLTSSKPYGGGNRLIIVKNFETATPEAANAFLKLLEEPPSDTYIILTTVAVDMLLPTIVSRSLIVRETGTRVKNTNQSSDQIAADLNIILKAEPPDRLIFTQKRIKTKLDAVTMIDQLISFLEQNLHSNSSFPLLSYGETAECIRKILSAKEYMESNVNYRATIDILLLGFPKKY